MASHLYVAQKMKDILNKNRGQVLFLFILVLYSIVFSGIAIWRYENFLSGESGDLLIFEQVIHNTIHGRPFYATGVGNEFSYHNSPILAFLVPFSAIMPAPYVLYLFTALSIAVSAIPIYLIAKENLEKESLSLFIGTAYIMLPVFIGQIYGAFHEINLVLPFLTFAFYFFSKERFYPFVAMSFMALAVKEDVTLPVFIFAIYALIKGREKKWYIVPAILSISWLLLSTKVIIPYFANADYPPILSYFSNKGTTLGEIVVNTVFKPIETLSGMMKPLKLHYLFVLLSPMALFLPFFSVEVIFALPSLFLNIVGESARLTVMKWDSPWGMMLIPRHMSLMPTVFLFISTIYSLKKIRTRFKKGAPIATAVVVLLMLFGIIYNNGFVLSKELYERPSYVASSSSIKRIISLIPRHATVKAPPDVTIQLYDRKEVYLTGSDIEADYVVLYGNFLIYPPSSLSSPSYLMVDADDNPIVIMDTTSRPVDAKLREKYKFVAKEEGIALFERKAFYGNQMNAIISPKSFVVKKR